MSVKKVVSGRRSGKADAVAPDNAQPAAKRRAAEDQLRMMIDTHATTHLLLINALRKSLQKRLPTAHEVVYEYGNLGAVVISYSPSEHGYEGVLAIRASANAVKLYFNQGKDLPDPAKLLKGSGQTRWMSVEGPSTLSRPDVTKLIDEALARNRMPFALAGRGPLVIRTTTAKTPRRRRPA